MDPNGRHAPMRLAETIARRAHCRIVSYFGALTPGVTFDLFNVRAVRITEERIFNPLPDHAPRNYVRAVCVPVHFVAEFQGRRAVMTWQEVYPALPKFLTNRGVSLIDTIAGKVLELAIIRLDPDYLPF